MFLHLAAIKGLQQIGDAAAVPNLLASLCDPNQYIRKETPNVLGQIDFRRFRRSTFNPLEGFEFIFGHGERVTATLRN
jgi:hypothetical protein